MDEPLDQSVSDIKESILKALRVDFRLKQYADVDFEDSEAIGQSRGGRADLHWLKLKNGELVAVKSFSKQLQRNAKNNPRRCGKLLQYFKRECGLWKLAERSERVKTANIHIAKILGFVETFRSNILPSLVIELYQLGNLRNFISKNESFSEKGRLLLLLDLASGLACLHDPDLMIVHRDIKGANILIRQGEHRVEAAIADFGSAKLFDNSVFPILNSTPAPDISWTPPEYLDIQGKVDYSTPSIFGDIWSFGCTFIETFTGADPWGENCTLTDPFEHLTGMKSPHYPPKPDCFHDRPEYWDFLKGCFNKTPYLRPSGRFIEAALLEFTNSCISN